MIIGPIIPILTSVALMILGSGALSTLIGIRLDANGYSPIAVGIVTAAYYTGLTLGSLQSTRLISRVGHIRAFAAFASIFSAATLGYALLPGIVAWCGLRFVIGICVAGIYMCVESWLNDHATNETRGKILSQYMITLYAAMAAGQQLINFDKPGAAFLFMIIAILLSLSLVPIALTRATAPALPNTATVGLKKLYVASPLGVAGAFLSGGLAGALYGLGPVYGAQSGFSISGTATFMTVLIAGGVSLQWPLGFLSDVFDRRRVINAISIAMTFVSILLVMLPSDEGWLFSGLAFLFGGLLFSLYPLSMGHTNDHVSKEEMIGTSGALILLNSFGAILGPLVASWAMSLIGPEGLFLFMAIGAAGLGAFGIWRTFVRESPSAEDQMAFQPIPQTSPAVVPLHPEAEEDVAAQ